jgi:hypothetical protein
MRDYTLIEKFLGLGPSKKELVKWIYQWWKPKIHFDLQLGSKGFFTIILHNLEDKNCMFDEDPYLFNSMHEFWLEEVPVGIENTIGVYVTSSKSTKHQRYTSYACICVYMNIAKTLPGYIVLEYQDEDWMKTIDYEYIPFRCQKFHENGHLFRDCPLNRPSKERNLEENKDKEGFIPVTEKHRQGGK